MKSNGARPSMFEDMWTKHAQYEDMAASAWNEADVGERGLSTVCDRLQLVTSSMQLCSSEVFSSIRWQIPSLKKQLKEAKERALVSGFSLEVRKLEDQLPEIF